MMMTHYPSFNRNDYNQTTLVGVGSFGKVLRVVKDDDVFVIKEFNRMAASETERRLFRKEAVMLMSLAGCENIVRFYAFSRETCSILLEFCCFAFEPLCIENDPVYNLQEFLSACDRLNDYQGFEHLQQHIANGIACG
jgi:serine/threonine protein kinase